MTNENLMQANKQWSSRPDDERFTSLEALNDFCKAQRSISRQSVTSSKALEFVPDGMEGLNAVHRDDKTRLLTMNNWAFSQAASLAGAPASYISGLPAPLAADCLNYGLQVERDVEDVKILARNDGLAALTGPGYGRVFNAELTESLVKRHGEGSGSAFSVPGVRGKALDEVTKANTTLYASDRDMFVFLADETNRIECPDRRDGKAGSLARGFFLWNSETGGASLGAAFFLFDYVCQNRIVWGAKQYKEIRIRHSSGAPDRYLREITPVLLEYSQSAAAPIEAQIKAAQAHKLDKANEWLANRYGKSKGADYMQAHIRDEGRPVESLWDVATAVTAHARTIGHQNKRIELEREAGKVLDLAA